ncbi:unnamed protein product [Citrullus colocynthis]|uniref:Uncharacterized protein n=1 Tax=Citrullus colocynthis TaxID=252529 RepID=A0ABP0YL82_9ROSI
MGILSLQLKAYLIHRKGWSHKALKMAEIVTPSSSRCSLLGQRDGDRNLRTKSTVSSSCQSDPPRTVPFPSPFPIFECILKF